MDSFDFILVARALHILGGVLWAGFILTAGFLMATAASAEDRRRLRLMAGRVGVRIVPAAALVTILSGVYLFHQLHGSDESSGAYILGIGAIAAILSAVVGGAVIGPAIRKLQQIDARASDIRTSPNVAALERRAAIGGRLSAVLITLAVLSMAVARYI